MVGGTLELRVAGGWNVDVIYCTFSGTKAFCYSQIRCREAKLRSMTHLIDRIDSFQALSYVLV